MMLSNHEALYSVTADRLQARIVADGVRLKDAGLTQEQLDQVFLVHLQLAVGLAFSVDTFANLLALGTPRVAAWQIATAAMLPDNDMPANGVRDLDMPANAVRDLNAG